MAVAFVSQITPWTSASPSASGSFTPTAGNCLAGYIVDGSANSRTLSMSGTGTYLATGTVGNFNDTNNDTHAAWSNLSCSAGAQTATVSGTIADTMIGWLWQYSGVTSIDTSSAVVRTGATINGTAVIVATGDMLFAVCVNVTGSNPTFTTTGTARGNAQVGGIIKYVAAEYAGSGGSVTPSFGTTISGDNYVVMQWVMHGASDRAAFSPKPRLGLGPNALIARRPVANIATLATITGTVAYTNANDTLAASGTTTVLGTLATTNNNDTISASGTTTVLGTLAKTNNNDTSAANGTATILGSLATTNANDTLAGSGAVGGTVTGTVNYTNANDTLAAAGTTTIVGSLARTNANDTLASSGTTVILGTLARTNANDTMVASGAAGTITGTVNYTNRNDSCSAQGSAGYPFILGKTGGLPKKKKDDYGAEIEAKSRRRQQLIDQFDPPAAAIAKEVKAEKKPSAELIKAYREIKMPKRPILTLPRPIQIDDDEEETLLLLL